MKRLCFTVDSALLRELGERLVGKSHIALAELVKNSYDADATRVVISFGSNHIRVIDNGHGMSLPDFKNFWMRVGSPHKERQRISKRLQRPMTGSKGVGRLAVQFLASKINLKTVAEKDETSELEVSVNWDEAVEAGDLTQAEAWYEQRQRKTTFPDHQGHGTAITLSGLKHQWGTDEIVSLAREIWWLQPPFRSNPDLTSDNQKMFEVELESPDEEAVRKFSQQMRASLDIWYARLIGKLLSKDDKTKNGKRRIILSLEFPDDTTIKKQYAIPDCKLHSVEFEIRVFHLVHRQPGGIKVEEARTYFNKYGGVHVYDSGFHLPYYGPESDWLNIEMDHSHRLSRSHLLPDELQVPQGMTFLPTTSRLFGVVHVNTAREQAYARRFNKDPNEYLGIQVTRDRLVDNRGFQDLKTIVRWALDFYAMEEAKRAIARLEAERSTEELPEKFKRVEDVLREYQDQIPKEAYSTLRSQVREAVRASETEAELLVRQMGLLGSLATAGMSAMAYEHEVGRQLQSLEEIAKNLRRARGGRHLRQLADQLERWIGRARQMRGLFSYLLNEENRERKARFRAKPLLDDVAAHMQILLRGIRVETDSIEETLRFPTGTFAEWSAIFQNVFANAANAMLDTKRKVINAKLRRHGRDRHVVVQDAGVGVDLESADELFKPFVRKLRVSEERRALGLGGTGLGLAIVRMVAENLGCSVGFVEPEKGFKTAFQLSWRERE